VPSEEEVVEVDENIWQSTQFFIFVNTIHNGSIIQRSKGNGNQKTS
jgi:hypothetical protein